jgi:hypothetical protein
MGQNAGPTDMYCAAHDSNQPALLHVGKELLCGAPRHAQGSRAAAQWTAQQSPATRKMRYGAAVSFTSTQPYRRGTCPD